MALFTTRNLLRLLVSALVFACISSCSGPTPSTEAGDGEADERSPVVDDIARRLARFPPTLLESTLGSFDRNERKLLAHLVEAGRIMDRVFLEQADRRNEEYQATIERIAGPIGEAARAYFRLNQGVYDRYDAFEPFLREVPTRPLGAGFYPADLTREEMERFIAEHPDREAEMISMTTRIDREGLQLVGTDYSRAHAVRLRSAVETIRAAAALNLDASTLAMLDVVKISLETDRYQEQARAWAESDGKLDFVVGAFETVEDRLFSYKAGFESVVMVRLDKSGTRASSLDVVRESILPKLVGQFPVLSPSRSAARRPPTKIVQADLVHAAGLARAGRVPLVFALPLPPDVVSKSGYKRVILVNVARAKSVVVLGPLAREVLHESTRIVPAPEALSEFLLLVEAARDFVSIDAENDAPEVEDIRAGHLALLAGSVWRPGASPRLEAAYVLDVLRRALLGPPGDHAERAWLQLGALLDFGAVRVEGESLLVDWSQIALSARFALMQGESLDRWAEAGRGLRRWRLRLVGLPVDIRPVFPLAGEVINSELAQ